jgi:hypothetical protein
LGVSLISNFSDAIIQPFCLPFAPFYQLSSVCARENDRSMVSGHMRYSRVSGFGRQVEDDLLHSTVEQPD